MGATGGSDIPELAKELFVSVPEHLEPVDASVQGQMPLWLKGSLIRVGPGKFEWGKSSYKHWFDGEAIFHCFSFSDGRVTYRSKFLESKSLARGNKYGRVAMTSFGTWAPPDPCKNIFARMFSYFLPAEMTDNSNINVVNFKDGAFATTETPSFYQVDPKTGDTLEAVDVGDRFSGLRTWLAHPHSDNEGNTYNFSTAPLKFKYQIIQIPPKNDEGDYIWSGSKVIANLRFWGAPCYFHSFGMTENFFILIENPLCFSNPFKALFMNLVRASYIDLMKWNPHKSSKIHIIDRHCGELVKTFTVEAFFGFHHINAYESGNNVIVDIAGAPDSSIVTAFYLHELRNGLENVPYTLAALRRYRLPLPRRSAAARKSCIFKRKKLESLPKNEDGYDFKIIMEGFDMPCINYEKFNGKKYTYVYGLSFENNNFFLAGLCKVNVDTGEILKWKTEHGYPSEPVFVERPGSEKEDDGVVLSMISGIKGKPSFLLILDAVGFKEIARAEVPHFLSPSFHGSFWNSV